MLQPYHKNLQTYIKTRTSLFLFAAYTSYRIVVLRASLVHARTSSGFGPDTAERDAAATNRVAADRPQISRRIAYREEQLTFVYPQHPPLRNATFYNMVITTHADLFHKVTNKIGDGSPLGIAAAACEYA